eukprot:4111807-Karenia_brevis.AAC.1
MSEFCETYNHALIDTNVYKSMKKDYGEKFLTNLLRYIELSEKALEVVESETTRIINISVSANPDSKMAKLTAAAPKRK